MVSLLSFLSQHDLDNLAAKHSNFEVTYVVNDAPHGSKVPTGEEVKNPYEIGKLKYIVVKWVLFVRYILCVVQDT